MDTARLNQFAEANHGLVTRAAAERAGMSKSAWYRAMTTGPYEQVHPGVARLMGSPQTRVQAIAGAVLAAQPGAAASHRSAAYLWDVPRPDDDPIDLMFADRTRGLELEGVVLHHPRDRRDLSPVLRRNTKTSNVLRWLCDLGAVDELGVPDAVQVVVINGFASPVALLAAVHVHARRGRHGVPALRDALADWIVDGKPTDSKLETAMNRIVAKFHLPPAEFHPRIAGFEVDFWIVGTSIVLECDGWESHGKTRAQFERDRERDSILMAAGYITIRFTYWQIIKRPEVVAQRVRSALERFSVRLGAVSS